MAASLEQQLAELDSLTIGDLRERWAKLTSRPVPRLGTNLLRLAWEIQAQALGGMPRSLQQRLAQLGAAKTVTQQVVPGMRLVREWNGTVHVVTIDDDGAIQWNGQTWRSLSEVARTITGTRWSGPAFFGLKHKRAAA
jgi:hypothetical protein